LIGNSAYATHSAYLGKKHCSDEPWRLCVEATARAAERPWVVRPVHLMRIRTISLSIWLEGRMSMVKRVARPVLAMMLMATSAMAMTEQERREYRDKLMGILPDQLDTGVVFSDWVKQHPNVLPPDFDALPKINGLPDAFTFLDGKRTVKTPQDWQERRAEIRKLFEEHVIGTLPPKPKLDQIVPVTAEQLAAEAAQRGRAGGRGGLRGGRGPASAPADEQAAGPATGPAAPAARGRGPGGGGRGAAAVAGAVTKVVDLKYGPNSAITTRVTLIIPPGAGPFPVLIGGGGDVTNRGYISCQFPMGVDGQRGIPPLNLQQYYPDHDFASMGQVAFTGRMVLDYLYTLPEVDKPHIAITGYSRGGKMAMTVAAFDERITAVIAGSTGVGGVTPWRYGSEANVAESIESTTKMFPSWYPMKFRFFAGREDRLPVDGNLLMDLVAPGSIMIIYGMTDEVTNTWGNEQAYYDAMKVYQFLGHPERLGMIQVPGHHGDNSYGDAAMRWLDIQFGKSNEKWENKLIFPWDYEKWVKQTGETVDLSKYPDKKGVDLGDVNSKAAWEARAQEIRKSVQWMLGEAPPASARANEKVSNPGEDGVIDTPRWVIQRSPRIPEHGWSNEQSAGITSRSIHFGTGSIRGDIYYPQGAPANQKLPGVVFLHGDSYPLGYMWVYRRDAHPLLPIAQAGYAVLAYDQSFYGARQNEAATFYEKYPRWSQLGRLVDDARAAVEALRNDPQIDPERIYLVGYGVGGNVALHTAALDSNVKGVVSICGFTPMRTDTPDKGTGGIARWFGVKPLMPRLGLFKGHEAQIPYDYQELIATIAPRPVYVYSPLMNRDATASDVKAAVEQAGKVYSLYSASGKLIADQPWDYFRVSAEGESRIVEWMKQNMK
jgi:dienelactone hydrolase